MKEPEQSKWNSAGPPGYRGSQFRFGPRVPCLIVSPYARTQINSTFNSHASVVKFCLRLFGLKAWKAPALAKSDPTGDLFEAFDFTAPPRLGVPSIVPNSVPATGSPPDFHRGTTPVSVMSADTLSAYSAAQRALSGHGPVRRRASCTSLLRPSHCLVSCRRENRYCCCRFRGRPLRYPSPAQQGNRR